MRPLSEFKNPGLKIVLTDVDDTLTEKGRIRAPTYEALWRLHDRGLNVVPVTGRPAGWCEMIARTWPVHGVVGENGAFYFCLRGGKMRRYFAPDPHLASIKARANNGNTPATNPSCGINSSKTLQHIGQEIVRQVPQAALASDQFCRLMNLAIDYCEDVPPLSDQQVQKIMHIFRSHGVEAHISSIHINGWLHQSNKLLMSQKFIENELGLDFEAHLPYIAFVGDSPNDAPSFKKIKNSFGVANIKNFDHLDFTRPQFITTKAYGAGFVEVVDKILG